MSVEISGADNSFRLNQGEKLLGVCFFHLPLLYNLGIYCVLPSNYNTDKMANTIWLLENSRYSQEESSSPFALIVD